MSHVDWGTWGFHIIGFQNNEKSLYLYYNEDRMICIAQYSADKLTNFFFSFFATPQSDVMVSILTLVTQGVCVFGGGGGGG